MNSTNDLLHSRLGAMLGIGLLGLAILVAFLAPHARIAKAADTTPFVGQMGLGSQSPEVTKLQTFLAADSYIYPAGLVTGYYGPLTAAAVTQYQVTYGLPQVGRVGPMTLASMNTVVASGLPLDVQAPFIQIPSVTTTGTTATVHWDTSENARGLVYYSTAPIFANETSGPFTQPVISGASVATTGMSSIQTVTLQGLTPNTTYYYLIEAIDASGNTNISMPVTFATTN